MQKKITLMQTIATKQTNKKAIKKQMKHYAKPVVEY